MTLTLNYCEDVQETAKLTTSSSTRRHVDQAIPAPLRTKEFLEYVREEAARTGKQPGDVLDAEIKAYHKLQDDPRWPSPDALPFFNAG